MGEIHRIQDGTEMVDNHTGTHADENDTAENGQNFHAAGKAHAHDIDRR